jgi:hypothetical protein
MPASLDPSPSPPSHPEPAPLRPIDEVHHRLGGAE